MKILVHFLSTICKAVTSFQNLVLSLPIPGSCREQHISQWAETALRDESWGGGRQPLEAEALITAVFSVRPQGEIDEEVSISRGQLASYNRMAEAGRPHRKGWKKQALPTKVFSRKTLIIKRSWQKSQWVHETGEVPALPGGSGMEMSSAETEDQRPLPICRVKNEVCHGLTFPKLKIPTLLLTGQPQVNHISLLNHNK